MADNLHGNEVGNLTDTLTETCIEHLQNIAKPLGITDMSVLFHRINNAGDNELDVSEHVLRLI
jgi:hypothetical protein